ncbi:MAG: alpha/beta hydrolase [Pseudomonadota bacterium]
MRIPAMILCVLAASTLDGSPAVSAASATTEQRLDHISVVKIGHGSPVVLIPGLGSPRAAWDGVAPMLAKSHTVYLVQVNGFGGDDPGANLKPGVLDGIVADLDFYLRREKAGKVRIVGHSMGGLAALMFARAHPERTERVMLVDALPYFPVLLAQGGPMPSADQIKAVAEIMRDRVAARYGKPMDGASIKSDVDGLAVKPESRVLMEKWAAAADPRVEGELLYEDMSTDMRPALASLAVPVTVVIPWTDTPFGRERTLSFYARQYAGAPKLELVDIAQAGHFVMLDQPELFADALRHFVAQ